MSLSNCQDGLDLFLLYELTTFANDKYVNDEYYPKWDELVEISYKEKYDADSEGEYVYVPQCSCFGGTLICLNDVYENSGYDCLFIQELVRLYMEGKIVINEK